MNPLGEVSPPQGPTHLAAGHAPPTPPHDNPLDDIYHSAPPSPTAPNTLPAHPRAHEILSDLPSRQRALDTDAYREGLANNKGQYLQAGFDEGYALGASLGLRVGWILGVLQGFEAAWKGVDERVFEEVRGLRELAQKELGLQELCGKSG
ncbi:hypothetical protein LEMA_P118100.1 [Plenodomus lingam JN3]|uniref:Protein YAE1 n=1 Tax=Leptosphaeria maculans (strain JN3 / isolate v23.1.3 / race Av1-4-5-6-7-8) TaxID=985895 RepID=E4ZTF1_LEPMJ|nr:hypothetical protein LEMA_P118100.1 [Plenodomus lingam JN3]CBX94807.1 hypothetical protein LEMA_P118100.1 [Plenodomus lingam JN3]